MPRVLILSAPYGSGHDRVAAALAQACRSEGAAVEVADHFERFVSPSFARLSRALFWAVLRCAPRRWGLAHDLSAYLPTTSRAMGGMNRLGAAALGRELARGHHDLVVHVHPTPAGAMSWLREQGATIVPHGIVLTDFVVHPQWIYAALDRYFVPNEEGREALLRRGLGTDRIVVSGVPIDAGFAMPPERASLRAALGLAADPPVVLVMGGMHGRLGGIAEVCGILAALRAPFQAVAVCGTHEILAARLRERLRGDPRFRVLGRVAEMHRVMGAADVVVTKAGAVTCAESLALERPMIFYRSLPGQERANAVYLEGAGAGVRADTATRLRDRLTTLLGQAGERQRLSQAAARIRRPDAARTVVKEMLALAERR